MSKFRQRTVALLSQFLFVSLHLISNHFWRDLAHYTWS